MIAPFAARHKPRKGKQGWTLEEERALPQAPLKRPGRRRYVVVTIAVRDIVVKGPFTLKRAHEVQEQQYRTTIASEVVVVELLKD